MNEQQRELDHWRRTAAYLAECHAANLERLPKSASKVSRKRLALICLKSASFMREVDGPVNYHMQSTGQTVAAAISRCETAALEIYRK